MSKEFNYKRAWKEYVNPEFKKLPKEVHKAFIATEKEVDHIEQIGASGTVIGHSEKLMSMFNAIPTAILAWAGEVVYYYGHLASNRVAQGGGLYWKFKDLASMSLINRKPYEGEVCHKAEAKIKKALKAFHDHKEGTEYDDEELPGYILSQSPKIEEDIIKILKVRSVNHKPDIFCIGLRHFPKDGGIFIEPRQAPCCTCGQDYDNHTYERAMFVKVLEDNKSKLQRALKRIKDFCESHKIRLDGFAMVKGYFTHE